MLVFEKKAKIKKAGNLNKGRSYVITTVIQKTIANFPLFVLPSVEKAAFMFNENFSAAKNAA